MPIQDTVEDFKVEEWNKPKVLEIFKKLNFNRYIERFSLCAQEPQKEEVTNLYKMANRSKDEIIKLIKEQKKMIFYLQTKIDENPKKIIKENIIGLTIYEEKTQEACHFMINNQADWEDLKDIFEDEEIKKISIHLTKTYLLLKQEGIKLKGIEYDIAIASYILDPTNNKLEIQKLMAQYLEIDEQELIGKVPKGQQINLFDMKQEQTKEQEKYGLYSYAIFKIKEITQKKLEEIGALKLFCKIDMPTVEVLSDMQWNGMYVDEEELNQFGKELTEQLDKITKIIYEMSAEEFNINSTKQLGEVLFEKMKLPVIKKTKNGYSTDVDVLEKLKKEDPIIEQILDYRQLMKLNSTYVEGLKPYINPKTKRIHSFFHQTITATGRISSTEPNLQNIPTRFELGKRVRKVFKPEEGKVYVDADYSQIELRVLAHISEDQHMIRSLSRGERYS